MPQLTKRKAVEQAIQKAYVWWLKENFDVTVIYVPNESNTPVQYRKQLALMGLMPGCADLIILWENRNILFHELKSLKGTQSGNQEKFERNINHLGFSYVVTFGLEQAKEIAFIYDFPKNPRARMAMCPTSTADSLLE